MAERDIDKIWGTLESMFHARKAGEIKTHPSFPNVWGVYGPSGSITTLIFIQYQDKLNVESMKIILEQAKEVDCTHLVVVYSTIITSSVKKKIREIKDYTIEIFSRKELIMDVTKHDLYCPHRRLSPTEVENLKRYYKDFTWFPKLLRTDPVCRYMNFQKNDIILIHRKDGTLAYRIVR